MGNPVGFNAITVPSIWETAGNELQHKGVHSPSICVKSSNNSTGVPTEECECEMKFNSSLCLYITFIELNAELGIIKKKGSLKKNRVLTSLSTFFTVSVFKN